MNQNAKQKDPNIKQNYEDTKQKDNIKQNGHSTQQFDQ